MRLQSASQLFAMRPACFAYNRETASTNVFQHPSADRTLIAQQIFDRMMIRLREEDIAVYIEQSDDKEAPDAIFPNNWFATLPDGSLYLFPMHDPSRRREPKPVYVDRLCQSFRAESIHDLSAWEQKELFLEGTGSMVLDHVHQRAYAALSPRTSAEVLNDFSERSGYRVLSFRSIALSGQPLYHTNVMMHIGEAFGACAFDAFDQADRKRMEVDLRHDREWVELSLEQMFEFAGNMLQVINRKGIPYTLLSERAYRSLHRSQVRLMEKHSQVLPIDIAPVEDTGGGSVRCMLTEIFLQPIDSADE
jgi:hypothetical protein